MLRHGKPGPGDAAANLQAPDRRETPPRPLAAGPDLAQSLELLNRELAAEIQSGKMQIQLDSRGLTVSLREAAFFASGDDTVSLASYSILEKIAAVVKSLPNPVRLEGHTDSVPIHSPRFRSNWELSSARAIAMLELFSGRFGLPPDRMAIAGYGANAPADSNDTEEGRAHNRRVDLVILTKEAAVAQEPQPAAAVAGR